MTVLLIQVSTAQLRAEPIVFESGERRTTLVELYTPEGCSSCPPSDRWIALFKDSPLLWSSVVPLSFHVDYWDYQGWKDEFSSAVYSSRQRKHQRIGNLSAVYTPGVLVDGSEWRGLLETEPFPAKASGRPGKLTLSVVEGRASGAARYRHPKCRHIG